MSNEYHVDTCNTTAAPGTSFVPLNLYSFGVHEPMSTIAPTATFYARLTEQDKAELKAVIREAINDEFNGDTTDLINSIYTERNQCISLIVRMAQALGLPIGTKIDAESSWPIVFVDLPSGQVSWHIPIDELRFFPALPAYPNDWDGHSTEEKYRRVVQPQLELFSEVPLN